MATAPTVQKLTDIVAELQPSVQGQVDVIGKQKDANVAVFDAQRSALDAAKVQGFNQINSQATGRGMAFGGIPLHEQAEYLSTKYLPGVQAANAQQNAASLAYDREIADLNTNVFNKAFDTRTGQVNTLNDWNRMIAGQDFSRSERIASQDWQTSERVAGQKFTTSEREASQNFTAAQNAADRSAAAARAAASGGGSGLTTGQVGAWVQNYVKGKQGSDTFVSPQTYRAGYAQFYAATGGDPGTYQALMSGYVNTNHAEDYQL